MAASHSLILEELALRVRRIVTETLQEARLWPSAEAMRAVARGQQARGQAFVQQCLAPCLGREDLAWLFSESAFGLSNHRLRGRVPMLAGFGAELAAGLHAWLACPAQTRAAAEELGALFNLGIVVFDLVCDELPQGAGQLGAVFDAERLRGLFAGADGGDHILRQPGVAQSPELRILFKIVAGFFRALRARVPETRSRDLQALIGRSFRSQLASLGPDGCSLADVQDKSALPFVIVGRTIRACCAARPYPGDVVERYNRLLQALGNVFWLVDDLADLCADLASGSVNSIALDARSEPGAEPGGELARRLLDPPVIERFAHDLRRNLEAIVDHAAAGPAGPGGPLDQFVLVAVRRWIERRR